MKRWRFLAGVGGLICLLIGGFWVVKQTSLGKKGGVNIRSQPRATVFLNNRQAGTTPYQNQNLKPGDLDIRLVPEGMEGISWQREFSLLANTELVIDWEFNQQKEKEAGMVIYFEPLSSKKKTGLVVTSLPDGASVAVDGQMKGFTPLNLEDQSSGDHQISISLPGYKKREVWVKLVAGHRLVLEVKLAKEEEETVQEATPSAESQKKQLTTEITPPYVVIKETPTGWLRVRLGPSTATSEVAKVKPGEKYPFLEEKNGWYKIRYQAGKEGWISGRYATKVEKEE